MNAEAVLPSEYLSSMQSKHPTSVSHGRSIQSNTQKRMSLFSSERLDKRPFWKGYQRVVGFDTMADAENTEQSASYTLQIKSIGYARTKHTRTFMCAVDATKSSERALEWIMENLVDDGDEIVAARVFEGEQDRMDPVVAQECANALLASIVDLNESATPRRISATVEFLSGPIKSSILRLATIYRPESLTIGTRGKQVSAFEKILGTTPLGNLSKTLIWQSPVPVIIVRPEDRVQKHLSKRMADPRRHEYYDLVQSNEQLPMSLPPHAE
ncbi:hypothetical protein MVES1_000510 [Malassezia vespertilionis]|uniref:UspA domain-containing protein n=1 Tax=Malassezia vespertilionis TaxID=2020962 RepID=A0A2N1JGE6_9BASI|nr:uncharacterized protein MVES1_000510 [Malassezia vespertilionis]PKI85627.1 hypothetical protein MVES_000471 [Malassezia vespertilionis]WFD05184.1 hypothetical protein MVES1_000510 [Malassezia vespertilionis]